MISAGHRSGSSTGLLRRSDDSVCVNRAAHYARHIVATITLFAASATPACEILGGEAAPASGAYYLCAENTVLANCRTGSSCQRVPILIDSRRPATTFCSATCTAVRDCPTVTRLRDGGTGAVPVACVASAGGSSLCYQLCTTTDDCPTGVCTTVAGSPSPICVPDNSSIKFFGEVCDANADHCANASMCVASIVSNDPLRASSRTFCTGNCTTDSDCTAPGLRVGGNVCITRGGASLCYERCDPGVECPTGMTCSHIAEINDNACVPPP